MCCTEIPQFPNHKLPTTPEERTDQYPKPPVASTSGNGYYRSVVQVTEHVNPNNHAESSLPRVDARSERWREHRLAVRQSFVEAALTAIEQFGPDVSMGDIAKSAGASKPKLYRHFAAKTDLYAAIVDHVQNMLWDRILLSVNLFEDSVSALVEQGTGEYAVIVAEHPNLFRFLVHSHFTQRATDRHARPDPTLASARLAASRLAHLFADATSARELDGAAVEMVSYSAFGAVASATDWWLGDSAHSEPAMPIETFTAYVASLIRGLMNSSCALAGVTVDIDQPMHTAFSRTEGEQHL